MFLINLSYHRRGELILKTQTKFNHRSVILNAKLPRGNILIAFLKSFGR